MVCDKHKILNNKDWVGDDPPLLTRECTEECKHYILDSYDKLKKHIDWITNFVKRTKVGQDCDYPSLFVYRVYYNGDEDGILTKEEKKAFRILFGKRVQSESESKDVNPPNGNEHE